MEQGLIYDIQHVSTHDGPGSRTAIFFKGCPLSCPWCEHPESQAPAPELVYHQDRCIRCFACVAACPVDAIEFLEDTPDINLTRCTLCEACVQVCQAEARCIVGKQMTVEQVLAEIEKDIPYYEQSGGGVTFSGGEALMQSDFLTALLQACRQRGIHTALHTSGCMPWGILDRVRHLVDLFLFELKILDNSLHKQFTGVSNERILANLDMLSQMGHAILLRVPLISGVNDDPASLHELGEFAASLPGVQGLDLLPYHLTSIEKYQCLGKPFRFAGVQPPTEEKVQMTAQLLQYCGIKVAVEG